MDEKQRYADGLQVRREVLGDAHVDRSLNALTEFNSEFQEMITRHAWGDIWTRPGLPRHTRSLITIAMLIGMNRSEEPAAPACGRQQWCDPRRDQGSADAECDLLRNTGGECDVSLGRVGVG